MKHRLVLLLILVFSLALAADEELDANFGSGILIIYASEHACYRFDIYIAETDRQRARGLMFVRHLPAATGMLFIYEADAYLSMWMKNTYISLDMLFIRADGSVSSVEHNTEPLSLRSLAALEPVRYVLEVNAGVAEQLSIDQYSRVSWERSGDAQ